MVKVIIEEYYRVEHREAVDSLLKSLKGVEIVSKEECSMGTEYLLDIEDDMLSVIQILGDCEVFHISDEVD